MSRIITINEMIEAGRRLKLPNLPELEQQIVEAADRLALEIASATGVRKTATTSEELELEGVACGFFVRTLPKRCRDEKDAGNPYWKEGGLLGDLDSGGELYAPDLPHNPVSDDNIHDQERVSRHSTWVHHDGSRNPDRRRQGVGR